MTELTLVKGMSARRQTFHVAEATNHWTADGRRTLCGLIVTHRVEALNPAKCVSCQRCSKKAPRP